MTTLQRKFKIIYGIVFLIMALIFLAQAITGQEYIPVFKAFEFLGLSRNIFIIILSMFIIGIFASLTAERIKNGIIPRNSVNQNKANGLGRSLIISIMTLWCTLVVVYFFGSIKLISTRDLNGVVSYLDFSNNQFFLNIYLFWFLFFSGIIGNIATFRAVTNPEEEKKSLENIKQWRSGKESFGQMIKNQNLINQEAEERDKNLNLE